MTVTVNNTAGVPSVGKAVVVAVGPATHLAVKTAPANATLGGKFGLTVSALDDAGHVDLNYSSAISITTAAALGGVTQVAAVDGVATFSGLSLNKVGLGYSLTISSPGVTGTTVKIGVTQPFNDFLASGQTQPTLFRRVNAGLADWFVKGDPSLTGSGHPFGSGSLDVPLSGDFDGDGKADLAIYRPSTGQWFVQDSNANYASRLLATFGQINVDIPAPGNYAGNGTVVPGVYRPTTGQWFLYAGGAGKNITIPITFPLAATPVPGDYDNTGKDEPATYSKGLWTIDGPAGLHTISFGGPTDIPVPGSYDTTATYHGVEAAVWRPSTGQFFIRGPGGVSRTLQFKVGDIPAPGDYDGIGATEAAVYRPSTGQWLVEGPNDTSPRVFSTFGGRADVPTIAPYPYRALKSGGGLISVFSVSEVAQMGFGAAAHAFSSRSSNTLAHQTSPFVVPTVTTSLIQRHRDEGGRSPLARPNSHESSLRTHARHYRNLRDDPAQSTSERRAIKVHMIASSR
jgi:hypothetical protein